MKDPAHRAYRKTLWDANNAQRKPLTAAQKARKMELQRNRYPLKMQDPAFRKMRTRLQYAFKKRKLARNPQFALIERLRDRLFKALKARRVTRSRDGLVDYGAIACHLGPCPGPDYEVDHIRPLVCFDLSDPEQIKLAFAPENHRWLEKSKNRGRPIDGSDL